jgi:hypothetical protein
MSLVSDWSASGMTHLLTTTEKSFREIARVPANPLALDEWKGSVAVMRINALPSPDSPQEICGEECFRPRGHQVTASL